MKKEFLDYLYELRGLVQDDINLLVEKNKAPRDGKCNGCGDETEAELRTRRSQLGSTNHTIEEYLKIHK